MSAWPPEGMTKEAADLLDRHYLTHCEERVLQAAEIMLLVVQHLDGGRPEEDVRAWVLKLARMWSTGHPQVEDAIRQFYQSDSFRPLLKPTKWSEDG